MGQCSSPGVSAQLLQFEVVQAHHFHRCCSDLKSPSQKAKTKLGCFSVLCNNQSVMLLLTHREDSTGHNTGLCPWKGFWSISSDCYMRCTHPHLVLAPSTSPVPSLLGSHHQSLCPEEWPGGSCSPGLLIIFCVFFVVVLCRKTLPFLKNLLLQSCSGWSEKWGLIL